MVLVAFSPQNFTLRTMDHECHIFVGLLALSQAEKNIDRFNQHYIAAVDLVSDGGSGLAATAIFNNQPFHSAGVAMKVRVQGLG